MPVSATFHRVVAKTASYTVVAPNDRSGTIFTNAGASGAITFTLPTPGFSILGWEYLFQAIADQNVIVVPPVADTGISLNDAAIDSLAIQTGSGRIGGRIKAICVLNVTTYQWVITGDAVGFTYTLVS